MWVSIPPAVRIRCEPATASVARPTSRPGVTRSMVCGLPALPIAQTRPSLTDVGLHDPKHRVDDGDVGDHQIGRAAGARHPVVHAHAFAHALAAAEDELVTVAAAQIAFDFDEQTGIPQADAITGRRAEQANVLLPRDRRHWKPLLSRRTTSASGAPSSPHAFCDEERKPRRFASATAADLRAE